MKRAPAPRHVIWITADHMRFDNIAAHGNPAMITPNLDRLVQGGVTFANAFVQNPVCVPSRCSFMTGLYPQQTGVTWNGHGLPPDFQPTVAHSFAAAGYQTTQIGKLHFQPHEDNDLEAAPRHKYGFDLFYGAEEPGCYEDAYMTWLRTEHPQFVEKFRIPRSSSPQRPRNDPNERFAYLVDAPWEASFSGWIATMASNFLDYRHRRAPANRHFMHLGFYAPHPPLNPTPEMFAPYAESTLPPLRYAPDEWQDKPAPYANLLQSCRRWRDEDLLKYKRYFYAMVTGLDLAVGRLLATLTQTGELADTLIVMSSDHGDMLGHHRMLGKGAHYYFDEVMRVPCLLHWPNGLGAAGQRIDGLIELVDLLPTLLDLCGGHVPAVMSGNSYADALRTGSIPQTRTSVLAYSYPDAAMLRTVDYKYCRFAHHGSEVLFDLREDPGELINIAADRPQVAQELRGQLLDRCLAASRSARPHHFLF